MEHNVRTSVYLTDENGAKVTFDEWLPLCTVSLC